MEINRGKSEGIKQHQLLLTDQYKHNEEETVKSKLRINQLKVWISERLTFFQTQEDRRSEKLLKQGERESKLTELEKEFILKNEILENKNTTALNILMHSAQLTSELESARTYKKNLEVQLSDLKNSSLALHQEHTHLKEKLILIQQESAQFMDQRKKIQEEITDLQFQQASAGEQVEKISSLIQQFQTELSALRSRHQILEELQNKFTGYDSGVKCILQSKKTEPLIWQDTLGIVADLITVDASCENIVESILGSQLQALVVKNQEQALGISNKLKLDVQGKVGILILSDLKQLTFSEIPHELQKHASYRGALIDFLKYDSEIKPIVQFLFSKVILVRELAEAIELNTRYPDFFFLAEDGSWVGPLGVWKTGSALKEVSLLGRHREILEIDQKIKSIEERLDQEEIQLKEARTLLATMMASRTQFEGQKEKILENISQLERSDFQTHELLEQVEKRQASQMQQQDDAVKNLEATDQKIHQLSAILSQNEQTHHLTQDEITAARKEIQALQSSKEEWIKQVLQIRMELETLEADAMRAKKEAEQYQQELDQMLILSDQKTEENVHINQRMEHLVMTLSESEHRIQQLTENYSSLDAQLQKIRVERDQFVLSVQDAMQQLNGFRSEAGENQKILHELELQEIAMNVGMRNIEEKLSLEYKVDLSNLPVGLDEKFSIKDAEKECAELQLKIEKLGLINMVAMEEYNDLTQRCKFLEEQQQDLLKAKDDLKKVINKINLTSKELFQSTFQTVQENFKDIFQRLFEGGRAELLLEEENVLESGIEIVVRPPGKRLQSVSLLSGGEKALTAIALLFALFMVKPSPFCLMDEIDAPLDEVNITRFIQLLKEFSKKTQFIVISHNKTTMETGDVIYGVTMQESGVSKVVSAKFREHTEESTLVSQ
jgi:chromosome segregation protein